MEYFVQPDSIVRRIWGKSDTVLFIFAGASAEFALNKAVDWLFYTGQLPADPLGRLFSTVSYARKIVFSSNEQALHSIDHINTIHGKIEETRGNRIPQWSYRDVLYLLISYSISAYELLETPLSLKEKKELYDVFYRVGKRMKIFRLPENYQEWLVDREMHLNQDLEYSPYTRELYRQYRRHLGPIRYWLLLRVQQLICPAQVQVLLGLKVNLLIRPLLNTYKISRNIGLDSILKSMLLPSDYKQEIRELDLS